MELSFVVVTNHNGSVWVAKNDLCAHINKLVDEEETALEHFLMDEHRTFGLRADHQQNAQQVRREARPRCITKCHERTIYEALYFVMLLLWNKEVPSICLDPDAQPSESVWADAQMLWRNIAGEIRGSLQLVYAESQ